MASSAILTVALGLSKGWSKIAINASFDVTYRHLRRLGSNSTTVQAYTLSCHEAIIAEDQAKLFH